MSRDAQHWAADGHFKLEKVENSRCLFDLSVLQTAAHRALVSWVMSKLPLALLYTIYVYLERPRALCGQALCSLTFYWARMCASIHKLDESCKLHEREIHVAAWGAVNATFGAFKVTLEDRYCFYDLFVSQVKYGYASCSCTSSTVASKACNSCPDLIH